jgi:hypothetical protein
VISELDELTAALDRIESALPLLESEELNAIETRAGELVSRARGLRIALWIEGAVGKSSS